MSYGATPVLKLPPKLAGETLIYSIDFERDLGGATVTASGVTVAGGTATPLAAVGSVVRVLVSGGTPGGRIVALFEAQTSDGQTLQCYALIPVAVTPG